MLSFDWDDANRNHIALHQVTPQEAEQVIVNNPIDLSYEIIHGEERFGQMGETNNGRVLEIFTTFRKSKIRVVTCFRPTKARALQYFERRGL